MNSEHITKLELSVTGTISLCSTLFVGKLILAVLCFFWFSIGDYSKEISCRPRTGVPVR